MVWVSGDEDWQRSMRVVKCDEDCLERTEEESRRRDEVIITYMSDISHMTHDAISI